MIDRQHGWNASFKPPIIGYVLSLTLIASMYRLVTRHHLPESVLPMTIFGLGTVQVVIQLVFFLYLGMESKPHWNSITFFFTVLVTIVVIGGSLWIMDNLNYNVMPPMEHGSP
jgi:cytochrome o ubiquinol oxidase subunit IV